MFLHVGGDTVINLSRVIAILDLKSAATGSDTRDFLASCRQEKTVLDITLDGKPKSLVITDRELYLSPISSQTLKRRGEAFTADLGDIDGLAE